ncbi:MAG: hypothetical protein NC548_50280 [Lachnospiraceae bacterium]|nr:hypothetical protein [Lachnospiraceae bacterium]
MGYFAFPHSFEGKKIVRVKDLDTELTAGITGCGYDTFYRYPASYLIPLGDPQYAREGNTANGLSGYMLNSRCWLYDVGLALLVYTTEGDVATVTEMLRRLQLDQNPDGSWNFSYDIYIGKLFHDYVRTGSMGWAVWGIAYALLTLKFEPEDRKTWEAMLDKAGEWMLGQQVTDDSTSAYYGLLKGGYGVYDNDYNYADVKIEWCSVEHQCSALQGLEGCALVLGKEKYKTAAELVRDSLYLKCYDAKNDRFFQGINGNRPDQAWALDCTTWAGMLIFSVVHRECASKCLETAREVFFAEDKPIVQSEEKDYFNQSYSSQRTFSGFKPYSDRTADYAGAPDIVWTEGTLGYAALAKLLGQNEEAQKYVDECIGMQECEGGTGGVLYVNATYGMMPWEFHVWESVVSSAWLYLLIRNPDVLFPRTLRQVYYMAKFTNIQDERPSGG